MSSLRDVFNDLYAKNGKLTPSLVVDAARSVGHPLHHRFEWDDEIAGEEYRRLQAAEMIRRVRVKYTNASGDVVDGVRSWHSVREEHKEPVYEPLEKVIDDPLIQKMVLRDMEREWRALHRRYGHMIEFLELVKKTLGGSATAV